MTWSTWQAYSRRGMGPDSLHSMSEHREQAPEPDASEQATLPEMPRTGHGPVDEVLRDVEASDSQPVDDRVAVFERAHENLRRALDHHTSA